MGIAHLGPEDMAYFTDPAQRYPPAVEAEQQLKEYAERTGGLTLDMWRLMLGHVWGQPYMMTMDEAAQRLGRPLAELERLNEDTNQALGWVNTDEQTPASDPEV